MSTPPDDGFLGRWSRRKTQARAGQPPTPAADAPTVPPLVVPAGHIPFAADQEPNPNPSVVQAALSAPEKEANPPTLDDLRALALDGDFKPFVARSVAPEVRNAAFRKLFSDPHFNVMDGLDIYIDDYGRPDPLPASALQQLASARFLRLLDDEPAPDAPVPSATDPLPPPADSAADPATAAASAPAPTAPPPDLSSPAALPPAGMPPASHAQDPDLQLQPDHAAGRAPPWPGAA